MLPEMVYILFISAEDPRTAGQTVSTENFSTDL